MVKVSMAHHAMKLVLEERLRASSRYDQVQQLAKIAKVLFVALGERALPHLEPYVRPIMEGRSPLRLTWMDLFFYGVHPDTAREHGLFPVSPVHGPLEHHPYQLAGALLWFDRDTEGARRLVDEYHRVRDDRSRSPEERKIKWPPQYYSWASNYTWGPTFLNPVDPAEYGLEKQPAPRNHSEPAALVKWFAPDPHYTPIHSVTHAEVAWGIARWSEDDGVARHARDWARQAAQHISYRRQATGGSLGLVARILGAEEVREHPKLQKGKPAVVQAMVPDAGRTMMVKGLRAMTHLVDDSVRDCVPHLGRSPTIDEIEKVKGAGLISVLYFMPWELLRPLIDEHQTRLTAHLAQFLRDDNIVRFQNCLRDHNHRMARHRDKLNTPFRPGTGVGWRTEVTYTMEDWERFYLRVIAERRYQLAVRRELSKVLGEDDLPYAFLYLLSRVEEGRDELVGIAQSYERFEELDRILSGYMPPAI